MESEDMDKAGCAGAHEMDRVCLPGGGHQFIIETASRHSAVEAWKYLTGRPLVFLYNTLLISICYLLVYLVKRKAFAAILVSFIWLAGGIANGVILANRVTPLTGPDLKLFKDALEVASHYLTGFQMVLMILVLVLAAGSTGGAVSANAPAG